MSHAELKPLPYPIELMKRNYALWKRKDLMIIAKKTLPNQCKNKRVK